MAQNYYGLDIGTSNFKMCSKDKILNEKNVIAIEHGSVMKAFGDEAYEMYEKAPESIDVIFPVKDGVIGDINDMQNLFYNFLNKVNDGKKVSANSEFYIAIPFSVTEVEKRAFSALVKNSKVKSKAVFIVDKPIADAIGAGLDVTSSKGIMVVNIGATKTEISVLNLGGIVKSMTIKTGGNNLDEAIISAIRKEYNLLIGHKTAEKLKIQLGSAVKPEEEKTAFAFGRNVLTGLPVSVEVESKVVFNAIIDPLHTIMDAIKQVLEKTPPELAADIISDGIYMTGGTSQVAGLSQFIYGETNLAANIVENPSESIVRGLNGLVTNPEYAKLAKTPD